MGKPRMIILIRHAQSEGNKNRGIHQFIPDHRVKLTSDGWSQAEEAGRRLRSLLKPDDTLQFFTSPYRRTRETTQGILRSLTSDDPSPSPFPRHKIKVFEEPRLREQDFGNFQPCSAEMERMWQERADYGHFFYRIPNGESAADAYDRVSGFNESMWRLFSEKDFPSVCVLVTHGLMTRVFLMKWYHWSVEYFEDLRNVNHCEFILMKMNPDNGKYILQNQLRTWSELKRRASTINTSTSETNKGPPKPPSTQSPVIPTRRWGGCVNGCNHDHVNYPRRPRRQNTQDSTQLPPSASTPTAGSPAVAVPSSEQEDHPIAPQEADNNAVSGSRSANAASTTQPAHQTIRNHDSSDKTPTPTSTSEEDQTHSSTAPHHPLNSGLHVGRDFGGTHSGTGTPNGEGLSDDSDYPFLAKPGTATRVKSKPSAKTKRNWREESGMGKGARADALGDGGSCSELDEDEDEDEEGEGEGEEEGSDGVRVVGLDEAGTEETPEGWARDKEVDGGGGGAATRKVEEAKGRSRQGFGEVY